MWSKKQNDGGKDHIMSQVSEVWKSEGRKSNKTSVVSSGQSQFAASAP